MSNKKERDGQEQEAERKLKSEAQSGTNNGPDSQDVLGDQGDEDVIF